MSSKVAKSVEREILAVTEGTEIGDEETLSSLGFSSNDFLKVWNKTLQEFPDLKDTKVTEWSLDKSIKDLLHTLSKETENIK